MFHARDALLAESIMKFTTGNNGSGADNCQRSPIANQHDCYCNLLNFCSKVLKFAAAAAVVCLSSSNVPTERETNSLCEENQNPNQQRSSTQPICQW
ncbi:Choline transporter-like [Trichinella spiralis]|uniref:Choline transporter-like n=1 Tax=Trichinella spiralis TaxID=6334 RepID=A0ABR3KAZ2_TRISP